MGTATVLTAAKTQEILDLTIASMAVDGDGHLIATLHNATIVDLGSVLGPQGDPGPTGDVSTAAMNAAILAAKNDTGLGVLDFDDISVDQDWGFDEDGWNEVTGLSVTFHSVTGRVYEIAYGIIMQSGADLVAFDVEARNGATVMARSSAFGPTNGRGVGVGGSRHYLAGTTGNKTIKLFGRGNTPNDIHVKSSYAPTWISVIDHGVI